MKRSPQKIIGIQLNYFTAIQVIGHQLLVPMTKSAGIPPIRFEFCGVY
ncbi:hypothetical protein COO91_06353 [Nostoc flagelliforme CCNUN1]|uniref:Uncharacterized protein n=1 Tax=Nostoc flagelliforme CCNUN1 TaxID=2038116 RepID=A0A2K8SY30_9NOSO|nr:hypothetical protein COO91_06353 [Nostoc flagelliforme CCNUN1]